MVSVASLLNPLKPEDPRPRAPLPDDRPSPSPSRSPHQRLFLDPNLPSQRKQNSTQRGSARATTTHAMNVRTRPKYEPYDVLDAASLREVKRFGIGDLGFIRNSSRRIPYNSSKKDFFSKTGRESFEGKQVNVNWLISQYLVLVRILTCLVFEYKFTVPKADGDAEYTVMWDYNVGLVRMTPFFRCLDYSKVCVLMLPPSGNQTLTSPDCSGKDAEPEPGPQGDHLQHHWRFDYSSRYVIPYTLSPLHANAGSRVLDAILLRQGCLCNILPPDRWCPYSSVRPELPIGMHPRGCAWI